MFDIFISAAFVIFTSFFPHLVTQCFVYYKEKLNAVNENSALKDVDGRLHVVSCKKKIKQDK